MPYELPLLAEITIREDWEDDDFASPYAELAEDVLPGSITIERGRDQGRVTGGPKAPTAKATLSNEERTYATENSGSPLAGLLGPGHRFQIGRILGSGDVIGDDPVVLGDDLQALGDGLVELLLFNGRTEANPERYGIGQRTVAVSAYGLMNRLVSTTITIPYQAVITTGAAMVLVWEAAGLVNGVDFQVDPDEILNGFELLHWYVNGRSAMEVTRQIWATAGPPSAVYERARAPWLTFEGRNYRTLTTRCREVQQLFTDSEDGSGLYHTDIQYDASYGSVINDLSLQVEQRATQTLQQVWQYGGVLTLAASEVREIIASNTSSDPWTNITTPVSPTDFTVSPGSLASVVVTVLGPLSVKITFTAGGSGATVNPVGSNTGFSLRAQPVTVLSLVTVNGTVSVTASQDRYGKKAAPQELSSAIWKCLSAADAAGLIDAYLIAYPEPRGLATVTLEAGTAALLYEIVTREISDRIHIYDQWSGIDLDVTIEQMNHVLLNVAQHQLVLICERVVELDWARFDISRFDISSGPTAARFGN